MKKFILFFPLFFCFSKLQAYDVIFNPYGGHNQYVSSLSSASLAVYNQGVYLSSPIYALNGTSPIYLTLQGTTTALFNLTQISLSTAVTGSLPATSLSGTIANARLDSSSVTLNGPILTQNNAFSGTETFSGQVSLNNASGNPIHGTNTNDDAASGNVGFYFSTSASAANFPASGAWGDLVSFLIPAGDWTVFLNCLGNANGGTVSAIACGISSNSGNTSSGLINGDNRSDSAGPTVNNFASATIPGYRIKLSVATTYYAKYLSVYTGGPPLASCRFSGRVAR